MLLLRSGADLNKIRIASIYNPGVRTFSEDYEIASQIANDFSFSLNRPLPSNEYENYSLEEIVSFLIYTRLPVHKQMHILTRRNMQKQFIITGNGGECIREYWNYPPETLIQIYKNRTGRYKNKKVAEELSDSVRKILTEDYADAIKDPAFRHNAMYLYRPAMSSNHFGQGCEETLFTNTFILAPLLDAELLKLQQTTPSCQDANLLYTLIYERFCPVLLDYRFEGGRSIPAETRETAKRISDAFPYSPETSVDAAFKMPLNEQRSDISTPNIKAEDVTAFYRRIFESDEFFLSITKEYDTDVYMSAKRYAETSKYHPLQEYFPLLSILLTQKAIKNESIHGQYFQYLSKSS